MSVWAEIDHLKVRYDAERSALVTQLAALGVRAQVSVDERGLWQVRFKGGVLKALTPEGLLALVRAARLK